MTIDAEHWQDVNTERTLLGDILLRPTRFSAYRDTGLTTTAFALPAHQEIWRAIAAVDGDGLVPEFAAVRVALEHARAEVSPLYILQLGDGVPTIPPANIDAYSRRLLMLAKCRAAYYQTQKLLADLAGHPDLVDTGALTHHCEQIVALETEDRQDEAAPAHIGAVLDELDTELQSGLPPVVPTPFPTLNAILNGGLSPGELVYLGARPGVGKTSLGLELARRAAKAGKRVLVVSREMVSVALARRLCAQEGPVSASALKRHRLDDGDRWSYDRARLRLRELPIWLTDRATSVTEITRLVDRADPPYGLVILDYLQLLRAPAEIKERRLQVEAISAALKTLALKARVPIVCLSSLSRPAQGNPEPTLASLRESGALEHDADIVMFLHRTDASETVCVVAKNREGALGRCELRFRGEFVSFQELERREEA